MFNRQVGPFAAPLLVASLLVLATGTMAAPEGQRKPPAEISIENGRTVALNTFEIVAEEPASRQGRKRKVPPPPVLKRKVPPPPVLKLTEPLAPGEKKLVKLTGAKGCSYRARWTFADAGDEAPIDLCGDPKIVLTD